MFLVSAGLFGWSGLRAGDGYIVAGSTVFGLACVFFLLPPPAERSRDDRG